MFDRFDALADMFGVQKVRKTANEYYLAAAGLPNPHLLPTAEDRACGMAAFGFALLNIMHRLNLELSHFDVAFSLQVGCASLAVVTFEVENATCYQRDTMLCARRWGFTRAMRSRV